MQNVIKRIKKNINVSTLIELLITLGIMSILLTMLSEILKKIAVSDTVKTSEDSIILYLSIHSIFASNKK